MVASPKLSKYFYAHEARGAVHATPDNSARPPLPSGPARRRGFPSGASRKRLSDEQRQAIIELLRTTPNAAAVARKFAEATRVTVSQVTVGSIKREAIKLGKLSPRDPLRLRFSMRSTFLGLARSTAAPGRTGFGQIGSA